MSAGVSILFVLERLHGRLYWIWRKEAQEHAAKWVAAQKEWFQSLTFLEQQQVHNKWSEFAYEAKQELRVLLAAHCNLWWRRFLKLEPRKPFDGRRIVTANDFVMREHYAVHASCDLFLEHIRYEALSTVADFPIVWNDDET